MRQEEEGERGILTISISLSYTAHLLEGSLVYH